MKTAALVFILCIGRFALALESRDVLGLELVVQQPGGITLVDGIPVAIRRVQGTGVELLARRIAARWREAGAVQELHQGSWRILSRWIGGRSELIQWRGEGPDAELLYSMLDPRVSAGQAAGLPRLPAFCSWGRTIRESAGQTPYRQATAWCRRSSTNVSGILSDSLRRAGWTVRAQTGSMLAIARGDTAGSLLLVPADGQNGNWVVWITAPSGPGGPR